MILYSSTQAMIQMDALISSKMALLQAPLLDKIMIAVSSIGSILSMLILSLAAFGFMAYKKRWFDSALFSLSMIGGLCLELLLKILIHRARPGNPLVYVSGYSFPSGHAVMAFIFFSLLVMLFKDDISSKAWRILFIASCGTLTLLVGLSRVYLNAHWLSDVIGGFLIGAAWIAIMTWLAAKLMLKSGKTAAGKASKSL